MLVSLSEVLRECEEKKMAVAAINVPSLDILRAIIAAAEDLELPVVIQHAGVHNQYIPMDEIGPIMIAYAQRAKIPVVVHLDHGSSFEEVKKAVDLGFSSVMIDASALPFEENVALTKQVVEYAHKAGVSVEAELGRLSATEVGHADVEEYTDPKQALEFVQKTGIDALAASFGTNHGFYVKEPVLDFDRLQEIHEMTQLPIVMHGGSGLKEEEYLESIRKGVRKINYFTYLAKAGEVAVREALENNKEMIYPDVTKIGENVMYKEAKKVLALFANR